MQAAAVLIESMKCAGSFVQWSSPGARTGSGNRDPPPALLFFSGAAGGEFNRHARRAPLKNKKKEGVAALVL